MWIYLALLSALLLGFYDISKKNSLNQNAVLPTLFIATCFGALTMTPFLIMSKINPSLMKEFNIFVAPLHRHEHFLIFVKSSIVGASWILSFFAIKHLPISIVTPIRALSPMLTLIGAIIVFKEMPSKMQWVGLLITMISYFYFSTVGKKEGIFFHKNKWVYLTILATLIGAMSSLYDKFIIQKLGMSVTSMQLWFSYYLVLILFFVLLIFWFPNRQKLTPFKWKWTIPLIGILLIFADFLYFRAIKVEGALIILISTIRRSSSIVSFSIGSLLFKDKNKRRKLIALIGVLIGIVFIVLNK